MQMADRIIKKYIFRYVSRKNSENVFSWNKCVKPRVLLKALSACDVFYGLCYKNGGRFFFFENQVPGKKYNFRFVFNICMYVLKNRGSTYFVKHSDFRGKEKQIFYRFEWQTYEQIGWVQELIIKFIQFRHIFTHPNDHPY